MRGGRHRSAAIRLLAGLALLAPLALAGCTSDGSPASTPPSSQPQPPTTAKADPLTFGVYGSSDQTEVFGSVVQSFDAADGSPVTLRRYANHDDLMRAAESGSDEAPDIFMVRRRDLAGLMADHVVRPVDRLLVERGMDFGDDYSRDALLAFSGDDHLMCMPYGISPMVIFYNTQLVDFDKMAAKGKPVPEADRLTWGLSEMQAAARRASRPSTGAKGFYLEPSLSAIAPFIYSGGGDLYNDDSNPTSLALSDSGSRNALERILEIARNPHLTLTDHQVARAAPLQWFKRGKLAMMEGYRDLVPELRQVPGLDFDVIAMPNLGAQRTLGDITGLCIRRDTPDIQAAADFLVHAVSDDQVARVVRAGYLVPANLSVANSEDFLEPHRLPHHAEVFITSAKGIVIPPLVEDPDALEAAVGATLKEIFTTPVLEDLDALTEQIDEESRAVLSPTPPASPSDGATLSPGESASPSN